MAQAGPYPLSGFYMAGAHYILIVDKAKGVISFEPKDEIFVVRFVLPNTVK